MALPNDPIMLYSAVNMRLRDGGLTLDELCRREDIDPAALTEKLRAAGFEYDPDVRQFR